MVWRWWRYWRKRAGISRGRAPAAGTPPRLLRDTALVLAAAQRVEPDRARRLAWYREDPIHALGSRTAQELVVAGEAGRLIAMIHAIQAMERGAAVCAIRDRRCARTLHVTRSA